MRGELMVPVITGSISTSYSLSKAGKTLRSVLLCLALFIQNYTYVQKSAVSPHEK
jgi:hypothetical protein